ncbi:MAG: hypothetical protein R3B13_40225 [Polyangiaceae bacterium]
MRYRLGIYMVIPVIVFATGCGEDNGKTPKCSELKLYNVREAGADAREINDALRAAVDAGCVTGPGDGSTGTLDAGGD